MAAPSVQGTPTTGYGSGTGEFVVTLPSGIQAGERLVVIFGTDIGSLMQVHEVDTAYSGHRWLRSATQEAASQSGCYSTIFTKVAEGGGSDVLRVFTGHSAQDFGYIAYRVSAANCIEYASYEDIGHDQSIDPPNLTLNVSQARETLWIAAFVGDEYATAAPSGYASLTTVSGSGARVSAATKTSTASSEDPGTFTCTGTNDASGAWTIGIYNETENAVAQVNQVAVEVLNTPPTSDNYAVVGGVYVEVLSGTTPPPPPPEYYWQWNGYFHDFMVTLGSKYTANFSAPTENAVPPDPVDCVVLEACDQPIVQCSVLHVKFTTNGESHYAFQVTPEAQTYLIDSVDTVANIGGISAVDVEHGRIIRFTLLDAAPMVVFKHAHASAQAADRLYLGRDQTLTAGDTITLIYVNQTVGATTTTGWFLVSLSEVAHAYDVGSSIAGKPTAGAVVLRYPFPRKVLFPSGLTGSRGVCATTATAQADFDVKKNGSSVGTMRFPASTATATFIMATATTFDVGDVLTIVAPGSQDATLADIGFGLAGTRY